MKLHPFVLGSCILTLAAACGSYDDDTSTVLEEEIRQDGQFRVVLTPVNPGVAGEASGTAEFTISGDDFDALVNVDGAPSSVHMQHVYTGRTCPDTREDTNNDGIIDAVEARAVAGGALIPLDSDLRSQSAGDNYPVGVNYDYSERTSLSSMIADLLLPDPNASDSIVKLSPNENLDLEGRTIIVHGVQDATALPGTVQGIDGETPQISLPILCGIITRADTGTGTTTGESGATTGTTTGM